MRRRLLAVSLAVVVLASGPAYASSSAIPRSRAGVVQRANTLATLTPRPCADLGITTASAGSGRVNGGNENELLLASPEVDRVDGKNGDDCLLGGGADDLLVGGHGTDVCIGGAGTDVFRDCEVEIE